MNRTHVLKLLSLAAIWGGSFIFIRVVSPVLGPVATTVARLTIAGIVLMVYFRVINFKIDLRRHWFLYFKIGIINSGIPFLFFNFAALYIPASLSAIINSGSPLWGAIFSAIWLDDKLTAKKILGLILGMVGVASVAVKGAISVGEMGVVAALSCMCASICYGLGGVYLKKVKTPLNPLAIAGASQLCAGLAMLPLVAVSPIRGAVDTKVLLCMLALAVVCSAIAYVLYYQLIADIGPARALTVTFIVPVFGMLWAFIFLSEQITLQMIIGSALIFIGTTLVLSKK